MRLGLMGGTNQFLMARKVGHPLQRSTSNVVGPVVITAPSSVALRALDRATVHGDMILAVGVALQQDLEV
jgi:hypothetical protein